MLAYPSTLVAGTWSACSATRCADVRGTRSRRVLTRVMRSRRPSTSRRLRPSTVGHAQELEKFLAKEARAHLIHQNVDKAQPNAAGTRDGPAS